MPRIRPDDGLIPLPDTPAHQMARGVRGVRKGRLPDFVPTDDQRHAALALAANGSSKKVIADILKINPATVSKHFRHEIQTGRDHITGRIGFVIVREALAGNIGAAKYWLDRHGGEAWQPKGAYTPDQYDPDEDNPEQAVQFYLPENGRDKPEDEPPTIDGDVDDLKTGTDDA
jgi:hypothetical protein